MTVEDIILAWKTEDEDVTSSQLEACIPTSPVGPADLDGSFAAAQTQTTGAIDITIANPCTTCCLATYAAL